MSRRIYANEDHAFHALHSPGGYKMFVTDLIDGLGSLFTFANPGRTFPGAEARAINKAAWHSVGRAMQQALRQADERKSESE